MLNAFNDELNKIAANVAFGQSSANIVAKPAATTIGPQVSTKVKTEVKPTNYTMVHNQVPEAASGLPSGEAAVPPPPVRT